MSKRERVRGWSMACVVLGLLACEGESFSPDARELCESAADCTPSLTLEECLESVEPAFERAEELGCVAEANAANRCTIDLLAEACEIDPADCEAEYTAYNDCVDEGGGSNDFSCDVASESLHYCVTYVDIPSDPEQVCSSLSGVVAASCTDEAAVGTCTQEVSGVVVATVYYGPLVGLTVEALEGICVDQGGAWTLP